MTRFFAFAAAVLVASSALAAPDTPTSPAGNTAAAPTAAPATNAAAKPASKPVSRPAAERGVMQYDTNKDGVVTLEEWKAGQEARFKRLDADGDGKLTEAELFSRTPAAGNSVIPSDRQASRQSAYFQRLDANRDGVVTLAEFTAQADRNFARCDVDKNGRIDTAECRQALQRKPAER